MSCGFAWWEVLHSISCPTRARTYSARCSWLVVDAWTGRRKACRAPLFPESLSVTTAQILRHATIDGSHALGHADEVGSLSVGKRAEVVLTRKNDNMPPATNSTAAVGRCANVGNIDTVIAERHPQTGWATRRP
ncbi:amidohydrolase family protein [Nocardia fluminea]|uniref:amidohydrolase family protein n=1 Tax=Nocardia fluminea TaxID=134984 RepID=UPI003D0CF509